MIAQHTKTTSNNASHKIKRNGLPSLPPNSMDSSSSRLQREQRTQDDIKKQIALLRAQLKPPTAKSTSRPPVQSKRKKREPTLLAPATPSPSAQYSLMLILN